MTKSTISYSAQLRQLPVIQRKLIEDARKLEHVLEQAIVNASFESTRKAVNRKHRAGRLWAKAQGRWIRRCNALGVDWRDEILK